MTRPGSSRPNILFVTFDQWRGDCLSAVGHPCLRTPHTDALAAEATLFRRHYGQASPCGPARASLLTGLYLHNHRAVRNGTPLDARHVTLAQCLRAAGYDPLLFGYTDTGADPRGLPPDDPRLQTYEGILPGFSVGMALPEDHAAWGVALRAKGYEVPENVREMWRPQTTAAAAAPTAAPARYRDADSETNFLTDAALEYIRGRAGAAQGGKPWCVHVSYLRPHPPFIAPAPWHAIYPPDDAPAPVRARDWQAEAGQHPWLGYHLRRFYDPARPHKFTQAGDPVAVLTGGGLAQLRATYYGMVSQVDAAFGRLVAELKRQGSYDNTIIVLTADHGEQLGDHWLLGKDGYFDATWHIPLILRDPRRHADGGRGRQIEAFTEAVDVMPSLLDLLGLDIPAACDGYSLRPFLHDGRTPAGWREAAHWEFDFRDVRDDAAEQALDLTSDQCTFAVIRDDKYKYVHFAALPPLLFDLARDPGELQNRAEDPDYLRIRLNCLERLMSWRMAHDDQTLTGLHLGAGGVASRRSRKA